MIRPIEVDPETLAVEDIGDLLMGSLLQDCFLVPRGVSVLLLTQTSPH